VGIELALTQQELNKFWEMATSLRSNLDAAEYKHIVLGLVFLKHISDSFELRRNQLEADFSDSKSESYKSNEQARANALETRDYYTQVNVFWVPEKSRWKVIADNSKQPNLATLIDDALYEIERENPKLEGIVERAYSSAKLPVSALGSVVDLISTISFTQAKGEAEDVLGQVYEYFLGQFANAEGKLGGQFYTTPSIVKTIVEVLQPTQGRVYDPACGSGGMFVQSERFVEAHGGKLGQIAIYGQESNPTTRRLCAMNLAIRGIDFNLGKSHGDTFTENQHEDLRFDYILMNPPFGSSASYPKAQLLGDVRWRKYGVPRERPANYAWMSHAIHHLAPKGKAGIVMPKNTLNSEQGTDLSIRKAFLDDDIVECIIEMPGGLFFNTSIPCALWFINRSKSPEAAGKVLFIDASSLGHPISKTQIEFSDDDLARIANTYNRWCRGEDISEAGWAASVSRASIAAKGETLATSRYVTPAARQEATAPDTVIANSLGFLSVQLHLAAQATRQIEQRINSIALNIDPALSNLDFNALQSDTTISVQNSLKNSLMSLTSGLFTSMFVDLSIGDPDGRLSSLAQSLGIAGFYRGSRQETEFGSLPENWRVVTLGEVAEVVDCLHSKKPNLQNTGKPYVQLRCIRDDGSFDLSQLDFINDEDYEFWTSRIEVRGGDCIITNVGRVGAVAQIPQGFRGAIGRNITAIRPKHPDFMESFLAELLLSDFMKQEIRANTDSGTVLDALNVRSISNLKLILPPEPLLRIFEQLIRPLRSLAQSQQETISGAFFKELINGVSN
jgi:type I restriction enzyme M protein